MTRPLVSQATLNEIRALRQADEAREVAREVEEVRDILAAALKLSNIALDDWQQTTAEAILDHGTNGAIAKAAQDIAKAETRPLPDRDEIARAIFDVHNELGRSDYDGLPRETSLKAADAVLALLKEKSQ